MNSTASLSTITLSEFRNTPFCPAPIIDSLRNAGCRTLADVVGFSDDGAMQIRGFGKGKLAKLQAFRSELRNHSDRVVSYYEKNMMVRVIGGSCESSDICGRISSFLDELGVCLEDAGAHDLAVICHEYFAENRQISDIAADPSLGLDVCRERIRQKAEELRHQIWTGNLRKYRIAVDETFLDDISLLKCGSTYKAADAYFSMFRGSNNHGFTNLLGLSVVKADLYHAVSLGEDYIIPSEAGIQDFIAGMNAVVEQLHREVRPQSAAGIVAKVMQTNPALSYEKILFILNANRLCENIDGLWQLRYDALLDYEKAARIVWEKKSLHFNDIDLYHTIKTGETRQISNSVHVAQNKFPWCRPVGRTGVWEYAESGESRQAIGDVIRSYVESHEVFSFAEAFGDIQALGYQYPEKTVRAYFMGECRSACTSDGDILCADSKICLHPEFMWRRRSLDIDAEWTLSVIADYVAGHGPSRPCEIARAIVAADSEIGFRYKSAEAFIYNTLRLSDALVRDADGRVSMNPSYKAQKAELPSHYQAVLAAVKAKVMSSPSGMCSLSSLKSACEKIIAPFAQSTLFYKILSEHCPDDLAKVYVGGKAYLRLAA